MNVEAVWSESDSGGAETEVFLCSRDEGISLRHGFVLRMNRDDMQLEHSK
jgi:hypothetical protein